MLAVLNICPIEAAGESKSARVKADTTIALHCNKSYADQWRFSFAGLSLR